MSANLPRMEALVRISNIPIVETGTKTAEKIYNDLKVYATNKTHDLTFEKLTIFFCVRSKEVAY